MKAFLGKQNYYLPLLLPIVFLLQIIRNCPHIISILEQLNNNHTHNLVLRQLINDGYIFTVKNYPL